MTEQQASTSPNPAEAPVIIDRLPDFGLPSVDAKDPPVFVDPLAAHEDFTETTPELGGHQISRKDLAILRGGLEAQVAVVPVPEAPVEGKYDFLFGDEDLSLGNVEDAAVRTPNIWEVINNAPRSATGIREVPQARTADFERALTAFGVSEHAPTKEAVAAGVERAKQIVAGGGAAEMLAREDFMDEATFKNLIQGAKRTLVAFNDTMYIDPALIKGTNEHTSWAGRGVMGSGEVVNGEGATQRRRPSIEQIAEYATRETQLPKLDLGINLVLTNEGSVFYSPNAHRASAAKLRQEPLGFSQVNIYDARQN